MKRTYEKFYSAKEIEAYLYGEEPTFEELVIGKTFKQADEYIENAACCGNVIHYFRQGEYMDTKDMKKSWRVKNVKCEGHEIFLYF